MGVTEPAGDDRAPVAALGAEALVAEHVAHELHPQLRHPGSVDAGHLEGHREPVAGKRGDDHVEAVGRVAAVGGRIGQRADDLVQVPERPGPAVGEDQRHRIRTPPGHPHEVDGHAVDRDPVVLVGVHLRLDRPPVVDVAPVADEVLHPGPRGAVAAVGVAGVRRPAGPAQAFAEVVEIGLRDLDPERLRFARQLGGGHGWPPDRGKRRRDHAGRTAGRAGREGAP